MKLFNSFIYVIAIILVAAWAHGYESLNKSKNYVIDPGTIDKTSPPCLQMYYNIEKYAEEYGIPRNYAFGIANAETGYQGPFHWSYDQARTSSAGAVGPMQIMPRYAHPYVDGKFTVNDLKTDIEMNVKASMRMLRKLYNMHGDWKLAFGAYNTGSPCVNGYAQKVASYTPTY
jgi:soluble lytic murein transglycosylase-like protein